MCAAAGTIRNKALAKSRYGRTVPVTSDLVALYADYCYERDRALGADLGVMGVREPVPRSAGRGDEVRERPRGPGPAGRRGRCAAASAPCCGISRRRSGCARGCLRMWLQRAARASVAGVDGGVPARGHKRDAGSGRAGAPRAGRRMTTGGAAALAIISVENTDSVRVAQVGKVAGRADRPVLAGPGSGSPSGGCSLAAPTSRGPRCPVPDCGLRGAGLPRANTFCPTCNEARKKSGLPRERLRRQLRSAANPRLLGPGRPACRVTRHGAALRAAGGCKGLCSGHYHQQPVLSPRDARAVLRGARRPLPVR
ncbi:hypothetical protein EDD99_5359 [Streptomyces sp. 846.5]|nr:hypothetical protein EDD99_5359 [Streptomyces sp. 846.5]